MKPKPRRIHCRDNLTLMRRMPDRCIHLIATDPPFNTGKRLSGAAGEFDDRWRLRDIPTEDRDAFGRGIPNASDHLVQLARSHSEGMAAFLVFLGVRLLEMQRILKDDGSIYLHCDPTASHYLKMLMDCIFGAQRFRNEIVWCYTGPSAVAKDFPRKHDIILRYVKGSDWTFNDMDVRLPYTMRYAKVRGVHGAYRGFGSRTRHAQGKIPTSWWADNSLSNVSAWKREITGYPTQKPTALYRRIVLASSNPGDLVFDPFMGSGTVLVAADSERRRWIGCDVNEKACKIAAQRLASCKVKV